MRSGMRHWLTGMIILAVGTPAQAETSASEFLQLSADRQAAYVAGILQGMAYVMFNYDRAGYERWDACVRGRRRVHPSERSTMFSVCSKKVPTRAAARYHGQLQEQ